MTNIYQVWPAILFGWPAVVVALGLSVSGIMSHKPGRLIVAAILILPFSLYLAGSPRIGWLALGIPLLLAAASLAIRYRFSNVAWLLLLPFVGIFGWLAVVVTD